MCLIILSICPCGINEVYLISSLFLSAWRPAEGGQGGELEPAPRSRESLWLLLTNTHPACPGRVRQLSSSSITQLVTLTPPPHHTRTHTLSLSLGVNPYVLCAEAAQTEQPNTWFLTGSDDLWNKREHFRTFVDCCSIAFFFFYLHDCKTVNLKSFNTDEMILYMTF